MIVRPALPEDALSVARVYVRSWQVAYRGLMPDAYSAGFAQESCCAMPPPTCIILASVPAAAPVAMVATPPPTRTSAAGLTSG